MAQEIAVLRSANIKPYDDALQGFRSVCCNSAVREYIISEPDGSRVLKKIRRANPDLIFAIGMGALSQVRDIKDIPIVYAMVSNPHALVSEMENITGVSLNVPSGEQLSALLEIMPDIKRIGLIYDPAETAHLVGEAKQAASELEVTLVLKEVHDPKEVPEAISKMKGQIDAFWMLPDITVLTKESVEYMLLFSFENNIPILSFSDKYVELGALIALTSGAEDIGIQAGEMANRILSGTDVRDIPMRSPRNVRLYLNLRTAKQIGIEIKKEIIKKSDTVK